MSDRDERIEELLARAAETMQAIQSTADDGDLESVQPLLDDLEDVADEAEDLASTVDLADVARAIDWEDLPEAVEVEDIPDAIEERDPSEAVSLRKLLDLTDLPALWENVDQREAWRDSRELLEEADDLPSIGDSDEEGDAEGVSTSDVAPHDLDPESAENAVQSEVSDAAGEFRESLLDAHDRLRTVREENQDRFPDRKRTRTRNPTAVSTLPPAGSSRGGVALHSTVPEETRHSSAPNRQRIYGSRFENARGDDDE